jgi:hypothetical protein
MSGLLFNMFEDSKDVFVLARRGEFFLVKLPNHGAKIFLGYAKLEPM